MSSMFSSAVSPLFTSVGDTEDPGAFGIEAAKRGAASAAKETREKGETKINVRRASKAGGSILFTGTLGEPEEGPETSSGKDRLGG